MRTQADGIKVHALVGAESKVVMAMEFSGKDTHGTKFMKSLLNAALKVFDIKCLLGDKAYLAEEYLGSLRERGIRATIPVKERWSYKTKKRYYEACVELVRLYGERQTEFHEIYRLRPLIEYWFGYYASDAYTAFPNEKGAVFGVKVTPKGSAQSRTFRVVANYPDSIVSVTPTSARLDVTPLLGRTTGSTDVLLCQ